MLTLKLGLGDARPQQQMPHDKEIPLMMPQEDAGSPPSPETIHATLTDGDNISEGPDPSVLTNNMGEEQPQD